MEIPLYRHASPEEKFWMNVGTGILLGVLVLNSCAPRDPQPTQEQRQNPAFKECVEDGLVHDSYHPTRLFGMTLSTSFEQKEEQKCLDQFFPEK